MDLQRAITTFDLYMSSGNFSSATRSLYKWALSLMCKYLENPELAAIKPDDLSRFWAYIRHDYQPQRMNKKTGPLAGRSLENIWTAERSFFGWCLETGKLKKRPDLKIARPEYAPREILPFSGNEIERMLDAATHTRTAKTETRTPFRMARATGKRDVAMIMVFVDTGMRASELARLTRADIDIDTGEVTIQAYGTGHKTKQRSLPIGRNTRLALWEYLLQREEKSGHDLKPDDLVFVTAKGRPLNKDSIRQVINEIGLAAGLPNVHPHRFRHTFASEQAAADVTEYNLMEDLGHSTSKMARRYVHLAGRKKTRQSIIDKIKRGK